MDPMHEALNRRKAKALEVHLVLGKDPVRGHAPDGHLSAQGPVEGDHSKPQHDDNKGDLAPEVGGLDGENKDADFSEDPHVASERKAMHAKMGHDSSLKEELMEHHLHNPEQEPVARSTMGQDALGHEESGHDADFERMMQEGHEHDTLAKPKTLGARVRAALHSKKGMGTR